MKDTNDKTYCVYAHINKINGKIYIGQTCQKPSERWKKGLGYIHSIYFYNAIQKYGWENFEHIILLSNLSLEDANDFEELLIKKLDTTNKDKGYNLKSGGKNNIYSNEAKQRMSEAQKGKHHSSESKKKMSKAKKGKRLSKEVCKKMSESRKGVNNCASRKIAQYDLNGRLIKIWDYMEQAVIELGLNSSGSISSCCRNKTRSAHGYIWRYTDNGEVDDNISEYILNKGDNCAKSKRVNQYTKDGKFIRVWGCMSDIERELGIYQTNVGKVCQGKLKQTGGFIWRYADNINTKDIAV